MNPDGTVGISSTSSLSFEYGPLGINNYLVNGGSKYVFDYDQEGRRKEQKVYASETATDFTSFSTTYDSLGNIQTFTEKDSTSPTAALAANVTSISDNNEILSYTLTPKVGTPFTYNFSYLKNGLLKSLGVDGQNYSFSYDEAGRLSSRLNHNKIEEQFVYNEAGQAVESKADLITTNTTGSDTETSMTQKWSTQYSYDDDGRIKTITGLMPSGYEATYTYNNTTEKLNLTG